MKIVTGFILGVLAIVIAIGGYFLYDIGQAWIPEGIANAALYKYCGIAAMAIGALLLITAVYTTIKK